MGRQQVVQLKLKNKSSVVTVLGSKPGTPKLRGRGGGGGGGGKGVPLPREAGKVEEEGALKILRHFF